MKRLTLLIANFCLLCAGSVSAQQWIKIEQEAKPYTRWWWLGSAVDSVGLEYNLAEYAKAGIGGVEITPIYGVQGNDDNEISYLSPRWMRMLKFVEEKGAELGIETNMATGTGWPFGGPLVSKEDAASKMLFNDNENDNENKNFGGSFEIGKTGQKVKRAAPGGEGFVIDHFDKGAVSRYLERFDTAFVNQQVPFPHTFFNDSYEVYGADWTSSLFDEFKQRRGYDLRPLMGVLQKKDTERTDADKRIISDYRETLGELLLENFTTQWTDWAHKHGSITRNQAHGSPANLLDVYAAVDIPECEGFGLSNFGIRGLRQDTAYTKKNFSDISMLKYASSGAHISGKKYTSSETFTWLTEHFRTSLSQCKPDLDLMFLSGVNHVFFHGSCYSPKEAEWPGWRFYASVDMTPNNNWWSAMPAFSKYIERCQSFLQWGKPDNDVLVYLPFYDMIYDQPGTVALFDIHSMEKRAPKFINTVQSIIKDGYDVDYVSDKYVEKLKVENGELRVESGETQGCTYSAVVVPDVQFMPLKTLRKLVDIVNQGGQVMFVRSLPQSVPGYGKAKEQKEFATFIKQLAKQVKFVESESSQVMYGNKGGSFIASHDYSAGLTYTKARRENMRNMQGFSCIRRANEDGYHYFVSNLQNKDVDTYIELGVYAKQVMFYNPMNGTITRAKMNDMGGVRVQLKSGESIIIRTFTNDNSVADSAPAHKYYNALEYRATTLYDWTLSFKEAAPVAIDKTWKMTVPKSWTELDEPLLKETMATGVYKTKIGMPTIASNAAFILDLGGVRETAHVIVNGKDAGTLFAVPYRVDITSYLHEGENNIEIEVCNLPANRIAKLDRDGVQWRKFKEINVVDLNYKKTLYDTWVPVPSGLCSEVKIIPAVVE